MKRFPPIVDALLNPKKTAMLDGVALDEGGHPRFEWLVNRGPQKGTLVYYVFDLVRRQKVMLEATWLSSMACCLANASRGLMFSMSDTCYLNPGSHFTCHNDDFILQPSLEKILAIAWWGRYLTLTFCRRKTNQALVTLTQSLCLNRPTS